MTLAIAHEEDGLGVLDAVREVRPPFSPDDVVADFAVLLRSYRLTTVKGDRYGGQWPSDRFRGARDHVHAERTHEIGPVSRARRPAERLGVWLSSTCRCCALSSSGSSGGWRVAVATRSTTLQVDATTWRTQQPEPW